MTAESLSLSVVIPTYKRGAVLLDTIQSLLALSIAPDELIVVDQTEEPDLETRAKLTEWDAVGKIRWVRQQPPSQMLALNRGLQEAQCALVLFLDDDVIPSPRLISGHKQVYSRYEEAWAAVGQVLQPEHTQPTSQQGDRGTGTLTRDLRFAFHGDTACWVENVMTGNLSVRLDRAKAVGGFDEQFIPPVSYRAETEFAKRLLAAGGHIRFEPSASLRHLRVSRGGTRVLGHHLNSPSPVHGVGDYYYALRWGKGWERFRYILRRPFREIRTKYHLRHPWWIPVKFIGEIRALFLALRLYREGPRLLPSEKKREEA